jgi:hypothetical protein
MNNIRRLILYTAFLIITSSILFSCSKPKEGKVVISEQEFSIRKDAENSWVIDAKGKVKNAGEVDVKNVVVTGYCKSCGEVLVGGSWFISDLDKTPEQKDTIGYLPVGAEEEFNFKGVAYIMDQSGRTPETMPDKLECEIMSFETVDQ